MKSTTRGFFITFEGLEGAGKSTQARRLFEVLKDKGYPVILTREPGGTPISDRIRELLIDHNHMDMLPMTELFLFAAARVQHVEKVIRPEIEEGRIVICDRFVDATVAYQAYGRQLPQNQVREINEASAWNVRPDITFLLDIEPPHGLSRVRSRVQENEKVADRMERESLEFFERVRRGYLDLAYEEPQRFRKIDSSLDLDVVHGHILECALRELEKGWGDLKRLTAPSFEL